MQAYEREELERATRGNEKPCNVCGRFHITSMKARQNGFVNKRPVSFIEHDNVSRLLPFLSLPDHIDAEIRELTRAHFMATHTARARIIMIHERGELETDPLLLLLGCFQ